LTQLFFAYARTALKVGLEYLGLVEGDRVLIPDYICDVLIHSLDELRIEHDYYPTMENLTPQWSAMDSCISASTKAVLMVHYFGQPQDIPRFQKFCRETGLFLIEDNAHGHGGNYQGQSLGTYGDIGVSSPRKILGTPTGGLLYLNKGNVSIDLNLSVSPVSVKDICNYKISSRYPKVKTIIRRIMKSRPEFENPTAFIESNKADLLMDEFSMSEYGHTDWNELKRQRQNNFGVFKDFALEEGLQLVIDEPSDAAMPWCLAAYTKNRAEAIKWFEWGWQNGVNIYSWPSLPVDIIHRSSFIMDRWKRMICFGIH
jgi:perosamine synthetase